MPTIGPILEIESGLADGQHIEIRRLAELCEIWKVPNELLTRVEAKRIAAEVDGVLHEYLAESNCLTASDLDSDKKRELALHLSNLLSDRLNVDIPPALVSERVESAMLYFGIKESYLYRDWQAALGDLVLRDSKGTDRHFDVIGFGEFEDRYIAAKRSVGDENLDRRWFDRVETLFHDLDITRTGMFDARRDQLRKLQHECKALDNFLEKKLSGVRASKSRQAAQ